ncbi:hypothetical protein DD600_13105 [Enterobacter cloacae]|nr:hypothetical protein DD600_13105 [Enterobacter cloacae]
MDYKNFSVLFFFKPDRQTALLLAALWKTETEKIEKNFSVFQYTGSVEDLGVCFNLLINIVNIDFS